MSAAPGRKNKTGKKQAKGGRCEADESEMRGMRSVLWIKVTKRKCNKQSTVKDKNGAASFFALLAS